MNKPKFRFTVLCEDKNHYHFIKSYLDCKYSSGHRVSPKFSPKGSAEQYVRDNFAREVKAHRSKFGENVVLIVVTDADLKTFDERFQTLACTLDEPLSENDKILVLIPSRNIETWFRYADNPENCDEETDYKHGYKKPVPSQYGKQYANSICQNDISLPALQKACKELDRLKKLLSG